MNHQWRAFAKTKTNRSKAGGTRNAADNAEEEVKKADLPTTYSVSDCCPWRAFYMHANNHALCQFIHLNSFLYV